MDPPAAPLSHVLDIPLEPPLGSAREAGLWVEEPEGEGVSGGGVTSDGGEVPTLVFSRADGGGVEQRFPLPMGTSSSDAIHPE